MEVLSDVNASSSTISINIIRFDKNLLKYT